MPCFRPLRAVRVHADYPNPVFYWPSGKLRLFFGRKAAELEQANATRHEVVQLPCGRCIGCKNRRTSDWGIRCYHESLFWSCGSFLSLTYSSDQLPDKGTLVRKHLTDFLKRLREELRRKHGGQQIRYFACGEYGELRGRPHYHALIFGWDFPDRVPIPNNSWAKEPLFESAQLTRIWGHGKATLGVAIGGASANYIAKYTLKRPHGKSAIAEYEDTGRIPPYSVSSQGIGHRWFNRFLTDIYPGGFVVNEDGTKKLPIPRRYDALLEKLDPVYFEAIKKQRLFERQSNPADETPERLAVREMVALAASQAASVRRLERREAPRS